MAKLPRIGVTLISSGETTDFLTAMTMDLVHLPQYGWQWESRFADGGSITGLGRMDICCRWNGKRKISAFYVFTCWVQNFRRI